MNIDPNSELPLHQLEPIGVLKDGHEGTPLTLSSPVTVDFTGFPSSTSLANAIWIQDEVERLKVLKAGLNTLDN